MSIRLIVRLAVILMVSVMPASAAPVFIDFTDASRWAGAEGLASFRQTYGALDVVLEVRNVLEQPLTFNNGGGIGIGDGELDVAHEELLAVVFLSNSPIRGDATTVLAYSLLGFSAGDRAYVEFTRPGRNAEFWDDGGAGYYVHNEIGELANNTIYFRPLSGGFALAGVWIDDKYLEPSGTPIPEPASLLLLGAGVSGAAIVRRRRRSRRAQIP